MNYPAVTVDTAAAELNRLHKGIEASLRQTVADAIRAGEILTQVKDRLPHGKFLPWIEANCNFSRQTADNYRRLYAYRSKMPTVGNVQEAYRVVGQIEAEQLQTEHQKALQRVSHYRETGEKPEGWRKGTDDKLAQEAEERDQRVEEAKARMQEGEERQKAEREARENEKARRQQESEILEEAAGMWVRQAQQRQEWKERIRLSQSGESDQFIEALMDYLDELEDDNRRIEACQNVIKVCRNIAAELQRVAS